MAPVVVSSYFNYIGTSDLCDFMKVSDSISSSDSENATHESKQEGNSRKVAGMIKKKLCNVFETYAKSMYMSKKVSIIN